MATVISLVAAVNQIPLRCTNTPDNPPHRSPITPRRTAEVGGSESTAAHCALGGRNPRLLALAGLWPCDFTPLPALADINLSRLKPGDQFIYVFDLGDDWAHLCTVGKASIDPTEALGIVPREPLPYFGWGDIPDQYGRAWNDDGAGQVPDDPELGDLPPLRPGWGGRS